MVILVITFVLAFVLLLSIGLLLFDRSEAPRQIDEVLAFTTPEAKPPSPFNSLVTPVARTVERLEKFLPRSKAEGLQVQARFIQAGFRNETAVNYFYGARVFLMLALPTLLLLSGISRKNYLLAVIAGLGIGYMLPDVWLSHRRSGRNKNLRRELPDFLDLLIVCVEAGLSLDQAMARTVAEMSKGSSAICDEFGLVILEQRAGCARVEAWRHLSARTNEDSVRNIVSMLVQCEQFGTSIAKALRVHAETLRTQRVQQIEEKAAKTTVKMLFPLVLLIFPAIFVVTLGPAFLLLIDTFKNNLSH